MDIHHSFCYCNNCKKDTNHSIVASYSEQEQLKELENILGTKLSPIEKSYRIVKCDGCNYVSFEFERIDHNTEGIEEGNLPITYPPKPLVYEEECFKSKLQKEQTKDIYKMYNEAIVAINSNCYQLATIGFRAVVEAICKNQTHKDMRLTSLIDELERQGLVSRIEKERLHKIRLEGNVTVHQFKDIQLKEVLYLKEVVEHIIKGLYMLEN